MQRWRRQSLSGAGILIASSLIIALRPMPAGADGALAIALPPDVVTQGFAYGYGTDYDDTDRAEAGALTKCRETTIEGLRSLCAIVEEFKNQCVAVATDPAPGTPGVGWAIAADLQSAEAQALSKCQDTAGVDRRSACVIDHSACDDSAK
jgi:hypothetical protein